MEHFKVPKNMNIIATELLRNTTRYLGTFTIEILVGTATDTKILILPHEGSKGYSWVNDFER